jgi:hypothetical protein
MKYRLKRLSFKKTTVSKKGVNETLKISGIFSNMQFVYQTSMPYSVKRLLKVKKKHSGGMTQIQITFYIADDSIKLM